MRLWRGILVAALVSAAAPRVSAEASKAEALIRQGVELRDAGRDARALPLFQQAYELERTPRTAGQLGLCELALGYWADAEVHLGEGLAAVSHPWIEKNRAVLTEAMGKARENLGEVMVAGGLAGAEVVVDRKVVGRLPLEKALRLMKGPHDVEVRAPGREPWRQAVMVAGADRQTVTVAMVEVVAPKAEVSTRAAAIVATAPGEEEPSGGGRRALAWTGVGVGALSLGFGAYETLLWIRASRDFDAHTAPVPGDMTGKRFPDCAHDLDRYGGADCEAIQGDLRQARMLALVSYGVGAVLVAGSVYLFATSPSPRPKTDTALRCAPDPSGKGLSCFLTF